MPESMGSGPGCRGPKFSRLGSRICVEPRGERRCRSKFELTGVELDSKSGMGSWKISKGGCERRVDAIAGATQGA